LLAKTASQLHTPGTLVRAGFLSGDIAATLAGERASASPADAFAGAEQTLKRGGSMTTEEQNMELMQTLDDAWNAQDWDTFEQRHKPDVVVSWPGQDPTNGVHDHRAESIALFKTFPDNQVGNRPYKIFFASGDWTCSVSRFTGTMTGPMKGADGSEIPPTGKSFAVDFFTIAKWDNGQIVEENLMYDLVMFMRQIGLSS
jgi:predicted ester cyclase